MIITVTAVGNGFIIQQDAHGSAGQYADIIVCESKEPALIGAAILDLIEKVQAKQCRR